MTNQDPTEGYTKPPPESVLSILEEHQEVFILTLDPDPDSEGESTIAGFMKFEENSRLSAYLLELLQQLLKTSRGKTGGNIATKTTISS